MNEKTRSQTPIVRGISEIRLHLYRNETPIYYVDSTNFNLMGIDEWVRRFRYINYNDSFEGAHPNIVVPEREHASVFPFQTLEELNNHLLSRPAVQEYIRERGPGKAVFLYFNEETVDLCKSLDLEVIFPSLELRRECDSKVTATRMADAAGVASVPNVLGRVTSYEELRQLGGSLGEHLVIQAPFGDSGDSTWFVSEPKDWQVCAAAVSAEKEVKVMKRIRCRQAAIEACVTRCGTIVGPLLTEIVGHPELTPYSGGWAGNEVSAAAFGPESRAQAQRRTERLGEVMRQRGYRGYFEVDYLFDIDNGEMYLGEINPRISGASSMTNLAAFAHADAPLFLFHLMEFGDTDFEFDVNEINHRWSDPQSMDDWGNLIIKHTAKEAHVIAEAPPTGVWTQFEDYIQYVRLQTHRRTVDRETEAFFLRIANAGDVVVQGDDLGVLVMRGRLMDENHQLLPRTRRWIEEIRARFIGKKL